MQRRTLSLKPRVDPATKPKLDPAKALLSEQLGMRFIDRGGRYIMQKQMVSYAGSSTYRTTISITWVDVPLVPEAYYP